MTRDEALKLLRGGKDGIAEWGRLLVSGVGIPDLGGAALNGENLSGALLSAADLGEAKLTGTNLRNASLIGTDLRDADLSRADLRNANLLGANLRDADLSSANLRNATLLNANLSGADLSTADFADTSVGYTTLARTDLSKVHNLDVVNHFAPATIGTDTLVASKGRVPEAFLRGCGLAPWEVIAAKLYDPDLTASEVNDLQYKIFAARTTGPIVVGGVFISYSHDDGTFVDKIRQKLNEKGITVWLDRHDLVAGPLQEQVDRALRLNDVVLLVLSKSSIESDWVEHELETALKKEKEQKRPILCPVALDAAWEDKMGDVLWRQVKKKNVLDLAKWKTKAFDGQFQKLLKGLKIYYEKPGDVKESLAS